MSTVFLSYAHSTDRRRHIVEKVASVLRSKGLTVIVDLDVTTPQGPPEGWPKWMKQQLSRADWVLMFLDEIYRRRFDGDEAPGRGLGVTWEGAIITSELYRSGGRNESFIPMIDDDCAREDIPSELFAFTRYRVPSQAEFLAQKLAQHRIVGERQTDPGFSNAAQDETWARTILDEARRKSKTLKKKAIRQLILGSSELDNLIHAVRLLASRSVVSLSGDLSWLERDLPRLRRLRELKPSLRIQIFFDKNDVSAGAAPLLSEVEELKVELKAYPIPMTGLKCLLLDGAGDSPRVFTFNRIGSTVDGVKPQSFAWREFGPTDPMVESTRALVGTLTISHVAPIRVAIVGANNVGKSSIASRLQAELAARFVVDVTDDIFKTGNYGTAPSDNVIMLWKQAIIENDDTRAGVRIFDRCMIDNYCFLKVRTAALPDGPDKIESESISGQMSGDVARQSHKYDLVVDVRRHDDDYGQPTKRVAPEERAKVRRTIDQFFRDHHIDALVVTTKTRSGELDEDSVDGAVRTIAAHISKLAIRRRVGPK